VFHRHGSANSVLSVEADVRGLGVSEVKRIKQLEEENRKLKALLGEQEMLIQAQREVIKKGWARDRP